MNIPVLGGPTKNSAPGKDLQHVAMLELLQHDPRPTFVLDATVSPTASSASIAPVYHNKALAAVDRGQVLTLLQEKRPTISTLEQRHASSGFSNWIRSQDVRTHWIYAGHSWFKMSLASGYVVVCGAQSDGSTLAPPGQNDGAMLSKQISRSKMPTFDWTDEIPPLKITPHVAWARSIDWSQTPLGPMCTWSSQLRSVANLVMQDSRPAVVFYGPDLIMIYNEAEIELLGGFHPCMGQSARVALASVWPEYFEPIITRNLAGETVEKTDSPIHMVRNGFMEETYFSLKFIPIFGSDGTTVGHYEPLIETTREVIARRQSRTLLALSEEIPRARNTSSYWDLATKVLSRNDKDIPFALLYSSEDDSSDTASSTTRFSGNDQRCTLRGSFGVPKDSPAGPVQIDFSQDHGFTPYFRQAVAARKPIVVSFDDGSVAADLVRGIDWQGFGDPCRAAVICPLNPTSSKDNILGFMVIGLNPRRPYDKDYHHFILVASRLLSTCLTSILLHEEDINRRERTIANAEAMRLELRQQLSETQKEVERSVLKFQRFAERADIGIFILDMDGVYSYRNQAWFDILAPKTRDIELSDAWDALIDEQHVPLGQAKFEALMETKQHQSLELRLKRTFDVSKPNSNDPNPPQESMWVLLSIFPELTEDGEVVEIIGCFTDISQQKWGEKLQATQASNAQESKRQLENFIDTTSHEMRNPLSAIVQCADSIISTHKEFGNSTNYQEIYRKILDTTIDAAETIVQCSKHMKTIVDDVLTMSKLDSGLFVMTPVDVQLESIARDAVRMFEGEAKSAGIKLEFCVEPSCKQLNVANVSLDPTRVLQILINLVTNAIKFTRLEHIRHITVSLGISDKRPSHYAEGRLTFLRASETSAAKTLKVDWDKGQIVYIIFAVKDTGRGLSDSERDLLFARFSQASPRTHIDYGGSGLGLFISRRLTEMHGGAIGFASTAGVGSTFAFYVKCRKSQEVITHKQSESNNNAVGISIRAQASALSNRTRDEKDLPPTPPARGEIKLTDLDVLIVEDNLVNQRVLAKQLRNIGMKVSVANHGGEALDHLQTTTFCAADRTTAKPLSLILMDWEMPVMDGLTCVRRIRELQKQGVVRGHIPVIAVTANVRSEQVEVALRAGMDDVISKPFRIPELCACVTKTLNRLGSV
ncbi:hypothetical protein HBI81_052540 [Parastagonospora nodorum]|nr:hypothetical protein HBI10_106060 [Parastagonospora nodorum]KAH4009985.1 hypothetical protein HBI13_212610 [Parastagonospora nodorum]KAH4904812.1 hypothetical protein HBH74_179240 [Parastagonospora nodorum]KAH4991697.1 hypothetical protein HBH73_019030 [Parastagonospora nodorum]KAH5033086.1 hypothetical protein HBI75_101750 [Parastagonospora nodorum]